MSEIKTCPHCGALMGDIWDQARLSPNELIVVKAIARSGRIGIRRPALVTHLYANHPDGGPNNAPNCISIYVNSANKKLAAIGLRIEKAEAYYVVRQTA